jgi:hypothetical protein
MQFTTLSALSGKHIVTDVDCSKQVASQFCFVLWELYCLGSFQECSQPKSIQLDMRECKFRGGVNWQGS